MAAESRFQVGTNTTPKCPDVSQVSFVTSSVPSVSAGWLPHRPAGRERGGAEGGRAAGGGRGRICTGANGPPHREHAGVLQQVCPPVEALPGPADPVVITLGGGRQFADVFQDVVDTPGDGGAYGKDIP